MQRLGLRERLHEIEVIDAWSKIVGEFIAAHSAPVALRDGILYVGVLQPALHYELEQVSKTEILRKFKKDSARKRFAIFVFALAERIAGHQGEAFDHRTNSNKQLTFSAIKRRPVIRFSVGQVRTNSDKFRPD